MDTPITDSYWVLPGRLLAGQYPGSRDEAGARLRLSSFLSAGITAFIDLTEQGELRPYAGFLPTVNGTSAKSITYSRVPIRDLGVPTESEMAAIIFPEHPNEYGDEKGNLAVRNHLTSAKRLLNSGHRNFAFRN